MNTFLEHARGRHGSATEQIGRAFHPLHHALHWLELLERAVDFLRLHANGGAAFAVKYSD
ncbi:MAG: hypothetical protein LBE78_07985 [Burkholderiaceae bacterium]|nr:hypothetical protein [Burkholderiaceae bacterium]